MNLKDTHSSISRRIFLAGTAAAIGAQAIAGGKGVSSAETAAARGPIPSLDGPFTLPPLPYAEDALAPHISAQTMGIHYGKHHKGYVDKLNKSVEGQKYADLTLDELIVVTVKDPEQTAMFNSAAQAWNHTFYWQSMKPKGGGEPTGKLADKLKSDLGGLAGFKKAFAEAALGQFGSGWAWLVVKDGKLAIQKTSNADTPIAHGVKPLLVIDVWEHAYYLDYQNKRADYTTAYLEHLVNWDFAAANLG
ncbi:MAG: superoxide dismutase [Planctomycetes bacterium]|nr:superoxide dismutase [Planctomycetota bacterium]